MPIYRHPRARAESVNARVSTSRHRPNWIYRCAHEASKRSPAAVASLVGCIALFVQASMPVAAIVLTDMIDAKIVLGASADVRVMTTPRRGAARLDGSDGTVGDGSHRLIGASQAFRTEFARRGTGLLRRPAVAASRRGCPGMSRTASGNPQIDDRSVGRLRSSAHRGAIRPRGPRCEPPSAWMTPSVAATPTRACSDNEAANATQLSPTKRDVGSASTVEKRRPVHEPTSERSGALGRRHHTRVRADRDDTARGPARVCSHAARWRFATDRLAASSTVMT